MATHALRNKNLLFYTIHPDDTNSAKLVNALNQNPNLKRQFIMICVNDPNIQIPDAVRNKGTYPVLAANGFQELIVGQDAVTWFTNGNFQDKANGFDYAKETELGAFGGDSFAYLGSEGQTSDYNQFYNAEYNHGFKDRDAVVNSGFAKLTDANQKVVTYDDQHESKKDLADKLAQKITSLKSQREQDVPRAVKRIGGLDVGVPSANHNFRASEPDPRQRQQRQLPFQMPPMPTSQLTSGATMKLPFQMSRTYL
jgi:hypothetical protein